MECFPNKLINQSTILPLPPLPFLNHITKIKKSTFIKKCLAKLLCCKTFWRLFCLCHHFLYFWYHAFHHTFNAGF
jgi:hypothetical protein